MPYRAVEWILVVFYGPSAHRATYGRLTNTKYTKDYIQLSRKASFLEAISRLFPVAGGSGEFPLTYQWPTGATPGSLVFQSADRPHLKWETSLGAPKAWRMRDSPTPFTPETIPGDPTHTAFEAAENELTLLASRGAGQPYLLAVKLRDEPSKLHLRAYLSNCSDDYSWADISQVPEEVRTLALTTTQQSALAWSAPVSGGVHPSSSVRSFLSLLSSSQNPLDAIGDPPEATARELIKYLRQPGYGLFFDPARNHDAWSIPSPLPTSIANIASDIAARLQGAATLPPAPDDDVAAEVSEGDSDEVSRFRDDIAGGRYEVPDATSTTKTRGSAQRAFADRVKENYGQRCAICGISTRAFLVAAHIVPWSTDASIRIDPANGICLSLLLDRAFEAGFILIDDDLTVRVNRDRIGEDAALLRQLEEFDGTRVSVPTREPPKVAYLQRRRALVGSAI